MSGLFNEFTDLLKRVRWFVFFNVLIAAFLIGVIVHELTNVLILGHGMRICLHIGELPTVVSICCLTEQEMQQGWLRTETIPLAALFIFMLLWVFAFRALYVKSICPQKYEKSGKEEKK